MSTSGRMVKTWLTGSGRFGLRRRALTRGSVISDSLDISIVSKAEVSGDFEELGLDFVMRELLARLINASPCR